MPIKKQTEAFPGSATKQSNTAFYWGVPAAVGLLIFYLAVLSLAESAAHAWQTFTDLWYWILVLAVGFAVQVGLFTYQVALTRVFFPMLRYHFVFLVISAAV